MTLTRRTDVCSHQWFDVFQDAYLHTLRRVYREPQYRNAPRGFASREVLGQTFTIGDPVQRHLALPSRRTNLVFNYAEALWYLSGSNELAFIAHYAPSIRKYSADGLTLQGTAYGPRVFRRGDSPIDQWANVLRTLTVDPDSKRAVLQIFDYGELADPASIDVACTLALQYLIRDGRLHGIGYMRANDAYRGVVSDVFSFTLFLELMANQLGLAVGTYTHHVGSYHLYESDAARAVDVLAEACADTPRPPRFPAMPPGDNWPWVREVLRLERLLRQDELRLDTAALRRLDLPGYWQHVLVLLEAQRQVRYGGGADGRLLDLLPDYHRSTLAHRWPHHFGHGSPPVPSTTTGAVAARRAPYPERTPS